LELTMEDFVLTITDQPTDNAEAIIEGGLDRYNVNQAGHSDSRPLAVLINDPVTNAVVGGLLGRTTLGLFFVDLIFVPDALRGRGVGSRILEAAEREAIQRKCSAVALYTISFQAPAFYARQGYCELGMLSHGCLVRVTGGRLFSGISWRCGRQRSHLSSAERHVRGQTRRRLGPRITTSYRVHERGLDHQIRLAVSLAAIAGTLSFVLSGALPELPSKQTVEVPASRT
jgi:GNAT superfamily N-acetyltransferase